MVSVPSSSTRHTSRVTRHTLKTVVEVSSKSKPEAEADPAVNGRRVVSHRRWAIGNVLVHDIVRSVIEMPVVVSPVNADPLGGRGARDREREYDRH